MNGGFHQRNSKAFSRQRDFMYEHDQDVDQSHATAAKWYRKAADQGCTQAQFSLGAMYHYGQGVD